MKRLFTRINKVKLIYRIIIGMLIGILIGVLMENPVNSILENATDVYSQTILFVDTIIRLLGILFVTILRSIAPILVFALVCSSLINQKSKKGGLLKKQIGVYLIATLLASLTAVIINYIFQIPLPLHNEYTQQDYKSPSSVLDVWSNLLTNIVANPIKALAEGNFLGILFWAAIIGVIGKKIAGPGLKKGITDLSQILTKVVSVIIEFAPLGICGLVYTNVVDNGLMVFGQYAQLLTMYAIISLLMFFVINPFIVFIITKRNPYPLVFRTIRDSAITAFFFRSSAANIPINMELCKKLRLDKDNYSVSIPLGSTINMEGAAITIITLTMSCCFALGIQMELVSAILISIVATISACGASGVSGGSILLIPVACSLFGIPSDVVSAVVGVGFIIGVIQDSIETALNSSSDVLFTAAVQYADMIKRKQPVHKIIGGTLDDVE